MDAPTREISINKEIGNTSSSSEKDPKGKEVENLNSSTDPEEMAMNKEISGLQPQFGVPDSAPYSNANTTRSQETQPASSTNRPHYSRDNTMTSTVVRNLPPLKRKETRLAQKKAHPWQHLGITL